MSGRRWSRALPVILGCSAAYAGGARAMGSTPSEAIGAGLLIALASSGLIALVRVIGEVGRSTRLRARRVTTTPSDRPPPA